MPKETPSSRRRHRASWPGSTASCRAAFLGVNAAAFAITIFVVLLVEVSPGPASGILLATWVGFLMLANGILHIVGTIAHARYSPGVVTGTLLYLPFGVLLLRGIVRDLQVPSTAAFGAAALGAVPMLVHGYLIVFRASRLF